MVHLVNSAEQAAAQVRRYNEDPEKLAKLMGLNHAWYALRTTDGWLLAPSKFVGYEISPDEYLGSPYDAERHGRVQREKAAPPLDGRVTERVLKQWSDPVERGHRDYDDLHAALNELCGRYGKKPRNPARISIIQTKPRLKAAPIGDDLVTLLATVFRRLTAAQKSTFRRLTN